MNAIERQLAAILVADVAGYTRLTENNEMATHVRLMDLHHSVMEPGVGSHSGHIVKTTGDGFLATFASIVNASQCAVALQSAALSSEARYPMDERLLFRIGLHVGDVIMEDNDIFGEGVNIAARLQQSAEPGGIVISAVAHEQLGGVVPAPAVPMGALSMKNISRPVRALRLLTDASAAPASLAGNIDQASVAVLPFTNVGSDVRNAYLGDGIVEDIIANLANFSELTVISRSSTLAYSGIHVDARTVGRQLGVRYVLNGRVSRDAQRLRVTAELSDAESSSVVWTGRYDATETDLFDIQDQLAAQIVHVIVPQVHARELRRIRLKRPEGMDAYDLVLQALNLHHLLDRRAFSKARQLLRRAIKLEPGYAMPYALLAEWYGLRYGQRGSVGRGRADALEATRLAAAALERDPQNVRALALYGHHRSYLFRDYDRALMIFDRASGIAPSSAQAWGYASPTFSYLGDGKTAIERAERALRLSPQDPLAFWYYSALALGHLTQGAFDDALHWSNRAFLGNPDYLANTRFLIASLVATGRIQEATEIGRKHMDQDPQFRVSAFADGYAYRDPERRQWLGGLLLQAGLPA